MAMSDLVGSLPSMENDMMSLTLRSHVGKKSSCHSLHGDSFCLGSCPKRYLLLLLLLFSTACGPGKPSTTEDEAIRIVGAIRSLEPTLVLGDCVDKSAWPEAVKALKPESVCKAADGVMIEVWSQFVESRGYLVAPVGARIDAHPGTDPSYSLLHPSLYWYSIKG